LKCHSLRYFFVVCRVNVGERADVEAALVVVERLMESRELVVGVPVVGLVEDAEPRLRTWPELWERLECFEGVNLVAVPPLSDIRGNVAALPTCPGQTTTRSRSPGPTILAAASE
jgi:hypothetical protein